LCSILLVTSAKQTLIRNSIKKSKDRQSQIDNHTSIAFQIFRRAQINLEKVIVKIFPLVIHPVDSREDAIETIGQSLCISYASARLESRSFESYVRLSLAVN